MKFTYKKSGAKRILPFFPGYHFLNSPMRSVCGEFNGGRGGAETQRNTRADQRGCEQRHVQVLTPTGNLTPTLDHHLGALPSLTSFLSRATGEKRRSRFPGVWRPSGLNRAPGCHWSAAAGGTSPAARRSLAIALAAGGHFLCTEISATVSCNLY